MIRNEGPWFEPTQMAPQAGNGVCQPGEARIAHRFGFEARRSKRARKHRWHSARRGGSRAYDARAAGGPNLPVGDSVRLAGGRWIGEAVVGSTPRGAWATVTAPLQRRDGARKPSRSPSRRPSRLSLVSDLRSHRSHNGTRIALRPLPDLRRKQVNCEQICAHIRAPSALQDKCSNAVPTTPLRR